jgi:hypothetical protein
VNKLPAVTDHAVLRYLERVKGFDIEAVRSEIATICALAGGAKSLLRDGVRYELGTDGKVITVAPTTRFPNATRRAQVAVRRP